jgi:sulfur carrier protein
MELTVNGETRRADADATVADLLEQMGFEAGARGVAVAVNGAVVPGSSWHERRLSDGDTVEIIHAVQGG